MADRYLLESGAPDGYLLEDGSGVLLLDILPVTLNTTTGTRKSADITVSGGDLTATGTRNSDDAVSANAKTTVSKFIVEFTCNYAGSSRQYVGLDDGSFDMSGGQCPAVYGEGVSFNPNQQEFHKDGTYQGFPAIPTPSGGQVTYKVDTTTGTNNVEIYWTSGGTTTLIKTFSWTPATGEWWAWVSGRSNPSAVSTTVNFVGPFAISPAGYSAYDSSGAGASNDISGTTALAFAPTATVLGTGSASGTAALTLSPSATLLGKGAVSGSSSLAFDQSGSLRGLLTGSSTLALAASATLLGAGSLSGSTTILLSPSATLLGRGAVAGSTTLTLSPSASLSGIGALLGSTALTFAPSATLTTAGSNFIQGSAALSLAPAATLLGKGQVTGSAGLSLAPSATLLGRGGVSGAGTLTLTPSGSVLGGGSVAGAIVLAFAVSGEAHELTEIVLVEPPANRTTSAQAKASNSNADSHSRTTYALRKAAA